MKTERKCGNRQWGDGVSQSGWVVGDGGAGGSRERTCLLCGGVAHLCSALRLVVVRHVSVDLFPCSVPLTALWSYRPALCTSPLCGAVALLCARHRSVELLPCSVHLIALCCCRPALCTPLLRGAVALHCAADCSHPLPHYSLQLTLSSVFPPSLSSCCAPL